MNNLFSFGSAKVEMNQSSRECWKLLLLHTVRQNILKFNEASLKVRKKLVSWKFTTGKGIDPEIPQ